MIRIILDDKSFTSLIKGEVVSVEHGPIKVAEIIITDIGYERMGEILTQAWVDSKLKGE